MKLTALLTAGAIAAGTLMAAAPAEAQHYRHDGGYHHREHRHGDYRHYHRGYGYNRGYGYRRGYGHRRVVCRIHRGRYGPQRRCFSVYR